LSSEGITRRLRNGEARRDTSNGRTALCLCARSWVEHGLAIDALVGGEASSRFIHDGLVTRGSEKSVRVAAIVIATRVGIAKALGANSKGSCAVGVVVGTSSAVARNQRRRNGSACAGGCARQFAEKSSVALIVTVASTTSCDRQPLNTCASRSTASQEAACTIIVTANFLSSASSTNGQRSSAHVSGRAV